MARERRWTEREVGETAIVDSRGKARPGRVEAPGRRHTDSSVRLEGCAPLPSNGVVRLRSAVVLEPTRGSEGEERDRASGVAKSTGRGLSRPARGRCWCAGRRAERSALRFRRIGERRMGSLRPFLPARPSAHSHSRRFVPPPFLEGEELRLRSIRDSQRGRVRPCVSPGAATCAFVSGSRSERAGARAPWRSGCPSRLQGPSPGLLGSR